MRALGTPAPTGQAVAIEGRVEPLRQRTDDLLSAARDTATPAAATTMAAAVRAAPVTTEKAVTLAALVAPTALAAPVTVPSIVPGLLTALGTSLLATNTPVAPAQVPVLWGVAGLGAPPESADAHRRDTAHQRDPCPEQPNRRRCDDCVVGAGDSECRRSPSAAAANVAQPSAATTAPPAFVQVSAATPQTNQSAVTVIDTGAPVAGNANPPPPTAGTLIKNAAYTGNLASMRGGVHNHYVVSDGVAWDNYLAGTNPGEYALTQVFDPVKGRLVARYEVRPGDTALNPPAERSQMSFQGSSNAPINSTYLYKFSTMFPRVSDPTVVASRDGSLRAVSILTRQVVMRRFSSGRAGGIPATTPCNSRNTIPTPTSSNGPTTSGWFLSTRVTGTTSRWRFTGAVPAG